MSSPWLVYNDVEPVLVTIDFLFKKKMPIVLYGKVDDQSIVAFMNYVLVSYYYVLLDDLVTL